MTLVSCNDIDTKTYYVRGTLYTDSTLTSGMADENLLFSIEGIDTPQRITRTDSNGHFGFAYNITFDPMAQSKKDGYHFLFIIHQGDTLYGNPYYYSREKLALYHGSYLGRRYWK